VTYDLMSKLSYQVPLIRKRDHPFLFGLLEAANEISHFF
jgi:hypothetical protein